MDLLKKLRHRRAFSKCEKQSRLCLLLTLCFLAAQSALAQTPVSVSLREDFLPASDLQWVESNGSLTILSSTGAWKKHVDEGQDLSKLNPLATNYWHPLADRTARDAATASGTAADAAVPIQSGDVVDYGAALQNSNTIENVSSGMFKVNVTADTPSGTRYFTVILHKNLHAILLKKEMLRRLGYEIQGLKWLKQIRIRFHSQEERDKFSTDEYVQTDSGDPKRWEVASNEGEADALTLTLQDVAVMESTPTTKTLAFGPPVTIDAANNPVPLEQRTLRALGIAYGVANIPESVNRAHFGSAHVTNGNFVFPVSEKGSFGLTHDDAFWMMRKVAELGSDEFTGMTERAFYPTPVAEVVTQVMIANRDNFIAGLGLAEEIPSIGARTNLAKIKNRTWPGYASEFVYGDNESPLAHFQHYLLSIAESNALSNLISVANKQIPSLNLQDAAKKHVAKMIKLSMEGRAPTPMSFHVWAAPLLDGGFDVSRNIALGSYLGTNNQLQLADSFGLHLNVGIAISTDPLPNLIQGQVVVQGSVGISLTHVKPLQKLSQATHTPLTDVFVPLFFSRLKSIFNRAGDIESLTNDDVKAALAGHADLGAYPLQECFDKVDMSIETSPVTRLLVCELDLLRDYLPVGDSLILSETLYGTEQLGVSAGLPMKIGPNAGVFVGANQLVLGRVQIYRKSATQIQVFKDSGNNFSWGVGANANLWTSLPIIKLNGRNAHGEGKVRLFNVDITPNPKANPNVYLYSHAIAQVLRTGSVELLSSKLNPGTLEASYKDRPRSFQFFQKVHRQLKTWTIDDVKLPDQPEGKFISLTNGRQRGDHFQLFATQVANYYVQKITESNDYSFQTQINPNPGQSIAGKSRTRDAQFQGRIEGPLSDPFVSVQYRWEGWKASDQKLQGILDDLNKRYALPISDPHHVPFFNDNELRDTTGMQLYMLTLNVNLYEPALRHMMAMSDAEKEVIVTKYRKMHKCMLNLNEVCASIHRFEVAWSRTHHTGADPKDLAEAMFIMASNLERFAEFEDLVQAAGGQKNLYVSAALSGFRKNSEMNEPVRSNSFGLLPVVNPNGVIDAIRMIFGIENGEFQMKWMRDIL